MMTMTMMVMVLVIVYSSDNCQNYSNNNYHYYFVLNKEGMEGLAVGAGASQTITHEGFRRYRRYPIFVS